MAAKHNIHPPGSHKAIAEQRWVGAPLPLFNESTRSQEGCRCPECFPLFVLTVDNVHYRQRMCETRIHLGSCGFSDAEIKEVHMLDLADHPELKPRSVIMEGWKRQVPLGRPCSDCRPFIVSLWQHISSNTSLYRRMCYLGSLAGAVVCCP